MRVGGILQNLPLTLVAMGWLSLLGDAIAGWLVRGYNGGHTDNLFKQQGEDDGCFGSHET